MMVYICKKFHENILIGIRKMERRRKVNGRADRWTDGGHHIMRSVFDGRIKTVFCFILIILVDRCTVDRRKVYVVQ